MPPTNAQTIAQQIAELRNEIRSLRRAVEQLTAQPAGPGPRQVQRDDGAVFIPATGWTAPGTPSAGDEPLPADQALAKVRQIRSARRATTDDTTTGEPA